VPANVRTAMARTRPVVNGRLHQLARYGVLPLRRHAHELATLLHVVLFICLCIRKIWYYSGRLEEWCTGPTRGRRRTLRRGRVRKARDSVGEVGLPS